MLVGRICAGIAGCVNVPNGPQKKKAGDLPTATLAASAYCCGLSPDKFCMFEMLITEFAGIAACPGATTLLSLSIPIQSCGTPPDKLVGQARFAAWICASVRNGITHNPPLNK